MTKAAVTRHVLRMDSRSFIAGYASKANTLATFTGLHYEILNELLRGKIKRARSPNSFVPNTLAHGKADYVSKFHFRSKSDNEKTDN